MRRALLSLLVALLPGAAPAADEETPLVVDVYPRREGGGAEALSRRMERADAAFRAICVGCTRGPSGGGGHFYPYQVLNAAPPPEPAE